MCQQLRRQLSEQNVRTILHLDMRPQL
jgi:hypothetical protein